MPTWALWAACLALCFLRALVAAAESALYGTSDLRAQELAESGASGKRVLRHKTEREATATALRLGACSPASWPRPLARSRRRGC
jgi:CBS domain containing-hemolysin-like protein